jgi:hypothetical protein
VGRGVADVNFPEGDEGGCVVERRREVDREEVLGDQLAVHHLVHGAREEGEDRHGNHGVRKAEDAVKDGGAPLAERPGFGKDAPKGRVGEVQAADGDVVDGELAEDGARSVGEDELAADEGAARLEGGRGRVVVEVLDRAGGGLDEVVALRGVCVGGVGWGWSARG